jgi:hypothetical protein
VADPHIKSNNRLNTTGIYDVILDGKGGQVGHDVREDLDEYSWKTPPKITFDGKKWMVLTL